MTVQERKTLEDILRSKLEDELTVKQMRAVSEALQASFTEMDNIAMAAKNQSPDDLLNAFIQAKRVAGLSEKTLTRYRYMIHRVLTEEQITPAATTVEHLRHWLAGELERGISESTCRGTRDILSSFFGWLWRENLIPKNPCANLEPVKCPKLQKKAFSSAEIEAMKEACSGNLRDKAIVCFLLASGCRIEELTRLNRNDIDFTNKECVVYGKGAKERTVYLDDVALAILQKYLRTRTDDSVALFPGRGSDRMTTNGVRRMLKRIEERCGVENIHPHRFRRTLATTLARKGMSVQEIASILGHEDVQTTMKYVCVEKASVKHHYQTIVA